MGNVSIGSDGDAIVSEVFIAAPPEDVFRALVDPIFVVKWWGGRGAEQSFRCTHFQSDLRPGGKWRSSGLDGQGRPFEAAGNYVEVDPPNLLVQTWIASWAPQVETTVRWELKATGGGTLVRHEQRGLATHPQVGRRFQGWPRMLNWIRAFLENNETVDDRWRAAD